VLTESEQMADDVFVWSFSPMCKNISYECGSAIWSRCFVMGWWWHTVAPSTPMYCTSSGHVKLVNVKFAKCGCCVTWFKWTCEACQCEVCQVWVLCHMVQVDMWSLSV